MIKLDLLEMNNMILWMMRDFDAFDGFNSFDEAWSAFGDMGEKPADVQPDVAVVYKLVCFPY